jgi:uncharacterized membrane protein YdjX (TVP38/TMEM64 family)
MTRRLLPYFIGGVLVLAVIVVHVGGLSHVVGLQALLADRQRLQELATSHPLLAPLAYVAVYIGVVALALPAATALSLLAGLLFGLWLGWALVLISASTGALIVFLITRSALGGPLRRKAGPQYAKILADLRQNGASYLLFLRLVPLFPFFAVNIVAGLFDMKAWTFFMLTLIGITPGSFVYVNLGRQLGNVSEVRDLLSSNVVIGLTLLGLLALTPVAYRHWAGRKARPSSKTDD